MQEEKWQKNSECVVSSNAINKGSFSAVEHGYSNKENNNGKYKAFYNTC